MEFVTSVMDEFQLTVKNKKFETSDAATFVFSSDGPQMTYKAGQFLTLLFERHGLEIRRSYSFSSAPIVDPYPSITVKRKVNGEFSRYLLDHIQPGDRLVALPPSGRFLFEEESLVGRQIIFIAAGSGIVPVFSILKEILFSHPGINACLLYQNRNEESIIFHSQLQSLARSNPGGFSLHSYLSRPINKTTPASRLSVSVLGEFLINIVNSHLTPLFYLCGPASFMRMAQFTIRAMGFSDALIKKENFTIESDPKPPPGVDPHPKQIRLLYHGNLYKFQAKYPESILDAALNNGIELPYSCRAGICSTCAALCKEGQVKMSKNEVLVEKELREGLVLTCVGFALTDLVLQF